ncbi:MAG TPA: hypothetical protein VGE51_02240 [Fontimonas sp.]
MNSMLKAVTVILAFWAGSATAANVGVSINIGDPGYYGRIDLGYAPRPELIYAQPIIVGRPVAYGAPLYLRVPPGHRNRWDRHCAYYGACGVPVYFVQDRWYDRVYVPAYRQRHVHYYRDSHHGRRYDDRRHDRHYDRDHDRGRGHGHGRGNDRGHGRGHDRGHDRDDRRGRD